MSCSKVVTFLCPKHGPKQWLSTLKFLFPESKNMRSFQHRSVSTVQADNFKILTTFIIATYYSDVIRNTYSLLNVRHTYLHASTYWKPVCKNLWERNCLATYWPRYIWNEWTRLHNSAFVYNVLLENQSSSSSSSSSSLSPIFSGLLHSNKQLTLSTKELTAKEISLQLWKLKLNNVINLINEVKHHVATSIFSGLLHSNKQLTLSTKELTAKEISLQSCALGKLYEN